ncbi:MAG: hypothetical protein ACO27F_03860 [Beijerinckiaceae bacterium]
MKKVTAARSRLALLMGASLMSATAMSASQFCASAQAQSFSGKTLTMVINYGAGGNVDTEGRIFERHLSKHIAGKPNIIVNNVPGAGGLTAINQLGVGVGVKDPSTTFGFVTFNPMAILVDDPALRVKVDVFSMIAGVGGYYVAYARRDAVPEQKASAFARASDIHAAGYARSSVHDVRLRLLLDLLGPKYQVVTGFQSTGAVNLAMERNEINFMLSTLPGYESQVVPNLVDKGVAMPLWQIGARNAKGELTGSEKLRAQGVKFFEEIYQEAHGKPPEGPRYRALQLVNELRAQLARAILMPPGASPAAVEELRKAFDSLAGDKAFIAEHLKIVGEEPVLIPGADAQRLVTDAVKATDAEMKKILKDAAGVN